MKFQLLAAMINLGSSRDDVVYRGPDEPVTLPEVLVLRAVHGGEEHVHSLVSLGTVERDPREELARLTSLYGAIAEKVFPSIGGQPSLPDVDTSIPDLEEVEAANAAAEKARADSRAKKAAKAAKSARAIAPDAPEPTSAAADYLPPLDQLPS